MFVSQMVCLSTNNGCNELLSRHSWFPMMYPDAISLPLLTPWELHLQFWMKSETVQKWDEPLESHFLFLPQVCWGPFMRREHDHWLLHRIVTKKYFFIRKCFPAKSADLLPSLTGSQYLLFSYMFTVNNGSVMVISPTGTRSNSRAHRCGIVVEFSFISHIRKDLRGL